MTQDAVTAVIPLGSFGETFTVDPKVGHTHTAIMIHGRGSDGEEFAEELFETRMSDGSTFSEKLPNWKWVFPSSKALWSTAFQEEMPAWFEAHSLTDITARQDLQISGLRDSVKYLNDIVEQEVALLEGKTDRVVMIGISQGAATGLWSLMSSKTPRIGAFIGASTWLPFAEDLKNYSRPSSQDDISVKTKSIGGNFVKEMIPDSTLGGTLGGLSDALNTIPVFLGHGIDDAYVDVELGRQARDVLTSIGLVVEWKEYEGAEQEGHWFKEPEEVDDILRFIYKFITEPENK